MPTRPGSLPKPKETEQPPIIDPEVVELPLFEQKSQPEFIRHRTQVVRTSIIPGTLGAIVGMALGAILGATLGLFGGPLGFIAGIFGGAFVGSIAGLAIGSLLWLMLPPIVRLLIFLASFMIILNWISSTIFHFSIFSHLQTLFK